MGERQIFRSMEFGALVGYNPFPDAFLYRVGFQAAARALVFLFVFKSRTLPADECVPAFVLPNLLPDAPHLKNRIIVIIRRARMASVLSLVPIEKRVILLRQVLAIWRYLALPVGVKVITWTKKPVAACSNLREHPVPCGIRSKGGH